MQNIDTKLSNLLKMLSSLKPIALGNLSGLARARQDSAANQVRNWSQKLGKFFAGGQKSVGLQEQFSLLMDDFQKQLDLILKYNWDVDHYLEEDVPAAVR